MPCIARRGGRLRRKLEYANTGNKRKHPPPVTGKRDYNFWLRRKLIQEYAIKKRDMGKDSKKSASGAEENQGEDKDTEGWQVERKNEDLEKKDDGNQEVKKTDG